MDIEKMPNDQKDNMDLESMGRQLSSALNLSGSRMKKNPSFGPLDDSTNNPNILQKPAIELQHYLTLSDITEPTCLCAVDDFLIIGYYSNSLGKVAVIRISSGQKSQTINISKKKNLRHSDNADLNEQQNQKPTVSLASIRSQSDSNMIPRGRKSSVRSKSDNSMNVDESKSTNHHTNYGKYDIIEMKTVAITPIRNITAWNQSNITDFESILTSRSNQFSTSLGSINTTSDSMTLEEVEDFRSQSMEYENPAKSRKKHGHDYLNFENGQTQRSSSQTSQDSSTNPVTVNHHSNTRPPYTILLISSDEVIQLWCINVHNGHIKSITRNNRNLQINISFTLPVHSSVISKLTESDFIFAQDGSVNTAVLSRSAPDSELVLVRKRWEAQKLCSVVLCVEDTVWTGHLDGRIIIWNKLGQPIKIIYEGTSAVCSLCLWENFPAKNDDGIVLSTGVVVSGHESGALRLWTKSATLLATFDTSKYAVVRPPPTQDIHNNNNNNNHTNSNGSSLSNGSNHPKQLPAKAFGPNPFRRSYPTLKSVLKITHLCVWKKNLCCAIFDQLGKVFVQIWNIHGNCLSYTCMRTNQPFYGFLVFQEKLCVARDSVQMFEALPSWSEVTRWIWAGHYKNSESFFGKIPAEVIRKILLIVGSDALSAL